MRYYFWGKILVFLIVAILLLFSYYTVRDINPNLKIEIGNTITVTKHVEVPALVTELYEHSPKEDLNLKYILQWTSSKGVPFVYMGKGQEGFISRSCKYTNCYVTGDQNYLGNITKFDAVAFNAPQAVYMPEEMLPQLRSPHQKYAFASIESSHYYPIYDATLDGYFNWTWTFKLDSDTRWGYLIIRNAEGNIIGPNKVMHWMKTADMKPVPDELLTIFKGKSRAAAWFVSNCMSKSNRELFAEDLEFALRKYDLNIDIYGYCGKLQCPRTNEELCDKLIEKHYYFYLAFENSFSEDYVTEKILRGLQYSAIPIVYGGANYSRFVPYGSYLDAREFSAESLAARMNELIHNIEEYSKYFKWRSHYSYHRRSASPETDDYCGICALLNDEQKVKETSVYKNLRQWWNP